MEEGSQLIIDDSDLEFGDQVGESGHGFGVVFKGHCKSRKMDVAIKRLSTKLEEKQVGLIYY